MTAATLAAASSATPDPIEYIVRIPAPQTHYLDVEAQVPTGGQQSVELRMAVWTPGSYLVREYARNVESVVARTPDGKSCRIDKTQKNRWRVETGGADRVVLSYRVYAREMTVRTNFVDSEFALINGAPTFLTLVEAGPRPHDITIELPQGWTRSVSALPAGADGAANHYRAPDYDTLVDSPIVAGNPAVYPFQVDAVPYELVNVGEGGIWDGPRSARDLEQIVRAQVVFWGTVPYPRFVFFNLITEAGGGLEHKNSTVLMTSRWRRRTRRGYVGWLGTASHEFFHAWNVKRLRPSELGPFDYEHENYTHSLWIAEGFTSYYGDLLVRRARLTNDLEYLEDLSAEIEGLQSGAGRLVQSADAASFDAWIKHYRPDENSPNTRVDYYQKGAVVAFLADAEIRRATAGAKSLDDVMRLAYARYSGATGYTTDQFIALVSEVAGRDLSGWLHHAVDTVEELDYASALEWYGLRFRVATPAADKPAKAWLGATTRTDNGRLVVTQVRRGTPAALAGVNVDDEILAIDDYRVRPDQWEQRMEAYRPGDRVELLVAHREQLKRLPATLGVEPQESWKLEPDPGASPGQQERLRAWLDGSARGGTR
jgi:predicted metalloprotease with PDZ domain